MEVAAQQDGPAELSVRAERVSVVREAIAGLDEQFREVLVLRDIQGLSYEELAETLDLPDGTVKSRLHRARRELMERLKPYWDAQE